MNQNPASKFSIFYNRLIIANAVLFFAIVAVLSLMQYSTFRKHELSIAREKLLERSHDLDGVVSSAANHVKEMRFWAEDYMAMAEGNQAPSPLRKFLKNDKSGKYYSLDSSPPDHEDAYGNIFGAGALEAAGSDAVHEHDMALWLMELMRMNHKTTPYFAWSFYISKNYFAANYPWVSLDYMLSRVPSGRLEDVFDHSYNGDNWGAITPEKNPDRKDIWRAAYVDNSGKGLVTTYVSPVYSGDEFIGAVAADVQLSFLARFTDRVDYEKEIMAIMNEEGQVLSHTGFFAEKAKDVPLAKDVFPGKVAAGIVFPDSVEGGVWRKAGGYNIFSARLESAPWVIVRVIPEKALVLSFLPNLGFYVLILLALAVFLGAVHLLIRNNFVRPSIAFVDFIMKEMSEGPARVPNVPKNWKMWFVAISDAMPFKAVSANLPGIVYQFVKRGEGDVKLSFVSAGAKTLTGIDAETLIGKSNLPREILSEDVVPEIVKKVEESERNMAPFELEAPVRRADGSEIWVRFIARPRKGNEGEIVWDGVALDITRRKMIELELDKHREHLEDLVDSRTIELKRTNEELQAEIDERVKIENALRKSERELGALSRRVISSQEEERARLSRELHDEFGQQLTAMLFRMITLRERGGADGKDLEEVEKQVKHMTADLRGICRGLSPVTLDRLGLESAVKSLVEEVREKTSIQMESSVGPLDFRVNEESAISIYRICQEAITNIVKHSGAKNAAVCLGCDGGELVLKIRDDGKGFDEDVEKTGRSLGLTGMKQRAGLCGGNLEIKSAPGQGTEIRLAVAVSDVREGDS